MKPIWNILLNFVIVAVLFPPIASGPGQPLPPADTSSSDSHTIILPVLLNQFETGYVEKTVTTPDYQQSDPDFGGLPGQGSTYCAPTAASNALIWLDDHGFDGLVPNSPDRKRDQFDLIALLGSSGYMDTNLEDGTGVNDFLSGVKELVHERGYTYMRLQYQGWRYHASEFSSGVEIPELTWIKQGTRGLSSAWINIGKYTYDPGSDQYTRTGGHYVTVVGYGFESSFPTPLYFIIHDPARGDYAAIRDHWLALAEITSGTLRGDYNGLPRDAAGYYQITYHNPLNNTPEDQASTLDDAVYILDGVMVLEMPGSPGLIKNGYPFLDDHLNVAGSHEGN
jgi:hypothetical protein